jgi:hypothetical protein
MSCRGSRLFSSRHCSGGEPYLTAVPEGTPPLAGEGPGERSACVAHTIHICVVRRHLTADAQLPAE